MLGASVYAPRIFVFTSPTLAIALARETLERLYHNMAWIYLVIAGVLEIGWAIGLKYTLGFTRLWPSVWTIACMIISFAFLALALKTIPVGTGYAVWTGIGAAGTAIAGIILFGEAKDIPRILCLVLIIAGVIGLKLTNNEGPKAHTEQITRPE